MVRKLLPVLMVFGVFIIPLSPAVSVDLFKTQTSPSQREAPEKMIEDGMKMILGAIQLILKSIPEYKAPEVLGSGDFIIRRAQTSRIALDVVNKSKKRMDNRFTTPRSI